MAGDRALVLEKSTEHWKTSSFEQKMAESEHFNLAHGTFPTGRVLLPRAHRS